MNESIFKTTLLLGTIQEKENLLHQYPANKIPQDYVEGLIEDLLKSENFYKRDPLHKIIPADFLLEILDKFKKVDKKVLLNAINSICHKESNIPSEYTMFKVLSALLRHPSFNKPCFELIINKFTTMIQTDDSVIFNPFMTELVRLVNKRHNNLLDKVLNNYFHCLEKCNNFNFLSLLYSSFASLDLPKNKTADFFAKCLIKMKSFPTKNLISAIQIYDRYDKNHDDMLIEQVREELKTREHIPNKSQKKLIRTMSIKAQKRLTLREAQLLNNKIKRKENEKTKSKRS